MTNQHRDPERITVGIDGSIASHHAVCWAIDHARPGDTITLLHASQPSPVSVGTEVSEPDDGGRGFVRHELARFAALPRDPAISLTGDVVHGNPGHCLVDADADLLVIGAAGHSRLTGALLGSVSAHLARHARVPLVIVPAPRQPREVSS